MQSKQEETTEQFPKVINYLIASYLATDTVAIEGILESPNSVAAFYEEQLKKIRVNEFIEKLPENWKGLSKEELVKQFELFMPGEDHLAQLASHLPEALINPNELLMKAIENNDLCLFKFAMKFGSEDIIDTNYVNLFGITPLVLACQIGSVRLVKELLSIQKTNSSKPTVWGATPLSIAESLGYTEIVDLLNQGQTLQETQDKLSSSLNLTIWSPTLEEDIEGNSENTASPEYSL